MTLDSPPFSPGLEGVPIAHSAISLVDGEAGRLTYRGYSIEDLTHPGATFEEVVALIYDGDLPDRARLAEVTQRLEAARAQLADSKRLPAPVDHLALASGPAHEVAEPVGCPANVVRVRRVGADGRDRDQLGELVAELLVRRRHEAKECSRGG